ncbi:MAG: hypothetical protein IIA45_15920 [Bacteroidetes bacterium]|nr:hypothetical protein [Bacteroidota bacterium]
MFKLNSYANPMNPNRYEKYQIYLHRKATLTYLQALNEADFEFNKEDAIDAEASDQLITDYWDTFRDSKDTFLLRCTEPILSRCN